MCGIFNFIDRYFFLLSQLFCVILLHCVVNFVGGMRIPVAVYITTPSTTNESEIKTDLVAPAPTSISQFYHHPTQEQFLYAALLHNARFLPFEIESQREQQEPSSTTDNQDEEENSYKVYRPYPEENPQFVDMMPPPETQNEPDYYAVKPRKSKKYSKAHEEGKQKKQFTKEDKKSQETFRKERESDTEKSQSENVENQQEQHDQSDDYSVEQSAPASRLDFQLHGN